MIRIKGGIAVGKNPAAFAFEIVELAAEQGPAEHRDEAKDDDRGERDQQVEAVHGQRARRIELVTTNSELQAMPRPAAQGGRCPDRASGMQQAL